MKIKLLLLISVLLTACTSMQTKSDTSSFDGNHKNHVTEIVITSNNFDSLSREFIYKNNLIDTIFYHLYGKNEIKYSEVYSYNNDGSIKEIKDIYDNKVFWRCYNFIYKANGEYQYNVYYQKNGKFEDEVIKNSGNIILAFKTMPLYKNPDISAFTEELIIVPKFNNRVLIQHNMQQLNFATKDRDYYGYSTSKGTGTEEYKIRLYGEDAYTIKIRYADGKTNFVFDPTVLN